MHPARHPGPCPRSSTPPLRFSPSVNFLTPSVPPLLHFSEKKGSVNHRAHRHSVMLAVAEVVVLVLEEHLLVAEVGDEGDGSDAEAGEGALEPVPPREDAGVAPGLTACCFRGVS